MYRIFRVLVLCFVFANLFVSSLRADACFAWCLGSVWPRWCTGECQVTGEIVSCIHGDCYFDRTALCMKWNLGGGGMQFIHVNCKAVWVPFPYSPEVSTTSPECDPLQLGDLGVSPTVDEPSWIVIDEINSSRGEAPEIYASADVASSISSSAGARTAVLESAHRLLVKHGVEAEDIRMWSITPPDRARNSSASVQFKSTLASRDANGFLLLKLRLSHSQIESVEVLLDQAGVAEEAIRLSAQWEVSMDPAEPQATVLAMIVVDQGTIEVVGTSAFAPISVAYAN